MASSEGYQPAELGWGSHETLVAAERPRHRPRAAGPRSGSTARARYPRAHLVPDRRRRSSASSSPITRRSRSRTTTRSATARTRVPPDLPLRLPPLRRGDPVLHEIIGAGAIAAGPASSSARRDRGRQRRPRRARSTATRRTRCGTARACRSRRRARSRPYQNATGLQVTSAVLAGMVWAIENPRAGIVEADEMDHARCLEVQRPYLGPHRGALHRLDAARDALAAVRRGDRRERSLAVPERARDLTAAARPRAGALCLQCSAVTMWR